MTNRLILIAWDQLRWGWGRRLALYYAQALRFMFQWVFVGFGIGLGWRVADLLLLRH